MTLQPASENKRLLALALRILGVSLLSGMMALVKLASDSGLHIAELMFWRQGLAVPVVLLWVLAGPGLASLKTGRFRSHAFRGGVGFIGMICNFASVILLPLAEATTISFAVPIFATILSAVFLHERVGKHRWGAVIIGFIGMLIVVQPGGSPIPIHGALIGLGGALMVATVSLQLRDLGKTESPATIVFWFSLLSMVPLGAILPLYVSPDHSITQWLLLAGIGISGGLGQIAITASLRYAPVSTVVVMDYFSLLTSALLGWLIWSHLPAQSTWYGAPVIVASGLYIVWREHRLAIARAGVVTV